VCRSILDLKVATISRNVARLCATFCDFPRLCFATMRDFMKIIANDCKSLIHMISFIFVPSLFRDLSRPFATFCDFGLRLWPRLCEGRVQDRHVCSTAAAVAVTTIFGHM
jgi:hypothetical protein